MEKRVFLAIFLSFLVLAIYQSYIVPPAAPVDRPEAATGVPGTSGPAGAAPAAGVTPTLEPAPFVPTAEPLVADTRARDIVVETDAVRAVFSTAGAVLTSWQLKHYLDADGQPFELVPQHVPAALPRPFTLTTDDEALSTVLARALYEPSESGLSLGSSPGTLSFVYRDASGLNARKTFHFQPEGKRYLLHVEAAVDVGAIARPLVLSWGPALGRGSHENGGQYIIARALVHRDGGVDRLYEDDLLAEPRIAAPFRFAGVEDHYFLTAVMRPETSTVEVAMTPITLAPVPPAALDMPPGPDRQFVTLAVSTPGATTLPFFLGPKDIEELRAVDPQLALAIDFGIFAALIVPLLQALKWIYAQVGNYGWAIVILTILINLAIFPLRHRSMVSMKKMQALQPAVKAIQERYAKYKLTDPERGKMNTEMMALYKQKGVNPASGCLPMLLTMPILFAFYSLLSVAIELRSAPFLGWITDLSAPDPSYITPLLMGASMMLQQHMMPTTADPAQRRIFMMMPVIFTVMFLWFPSGLVLYWLVSNLMAIGQQLITNRIIDGPKPATAIASPGNKGAGKS
ncbi:MAG TPA: membrane protein insertase YidC [Vicinamibacterales bacterium]|nr:membrane protein insertase YidC [Vicinamibacterales bacterium]